MSKNVKDIEKERENQTPNERNKEKEKQKKGFIEEQVLKRKRPRRKEETEFAVNLWGTSKCQR